MRFNTFTLFLAGAALLLVVGCESDLARQVSKYEKTRDYQSAKQLLQRTVRKDPANAEAQFLLGRLHMRQGAYEEGVAAFGKSREASARFVEKIEFLTEKYAHEEFKKGKKATESGSFGDAVRHFRNVTHIQPSNALAFRTLGHALVQTDQSKKAEEAYQKAIEIDPSVGALNNLAALTFRRGAYPETIDHSRQALELMKESEEVESNQAKPELVKRLAYAHLQAGQFSEAKKRFTEALKIAPSSELRQDYAFALYEREKYEEALPHLEQLTSGGESQSRVLHALGDTYLTLDRHQEASAIYLRLHERRPEDEDALQGLVVAYKELNQEEKSKRYFDKLEGLKNKK